MLLLSNFSSKQEQVKIYQPIFDKIEFVFNIKETINKEIWNTFKDKKLIRKYTQWIALKKES